MCNYSLLAHLYGLRAMTLRARGVQVHTDSTYVPKIPETAQLREDAIHTNPLVLTSYSWVAVKELKSSYNFMGIV